MMSWREGWSDVSVRSLREGRSDVGVKSLREGWGDVWVRSWKELGCCRGDVMERGLE